MRLQISCFLHPSRGDYTEWQVFWSKALNDKLKVDEIFSLEYEFG